MQVAQREIFINETGLISKLFQQARKYLLSMALAKGTFKIGEFNDGDWGILRPPNGIIHANGHLVAGEIFQFRSYISLCRALSRRARSKSFLRAPPIEIPHGNAKEKRQREEG